MRMVWTGMALIALAAIPTWAALDYVGGGETGSWSVPLRADGEDWGTTSYHLFLYDDGAPPAGGFTTATAPFSGVGLDASAWDSQLVNSHYFQMWTFDYPGNANYTNDSFRFNLAGPSTTPIYLIDMECAGNPNDLDVRATYCYCWNGGWQSCTAGDVYGDNPPQPRGPTDDSPELSTMMLLLASLGGGILVRRRRK